MGPFPVRPVDDASGGGLLGLRLPAREIAVVAASDAESLQPEDTAAPAPGALK